MRQLEKVTIGLLEEDYNMIIGYIRTLGRRLPPIQWHSQCVLAGKYVES